MSGIKTNHTYPHRPNYLVNLMRNDSYCNCLNHLIGRLLIYIDFLMQIVHGVHIEPAHEVKKRSISQPLRILLSYDDSVYR